MVKMKAFSDRYPLLGPLIWVATVEYFIIQYFVAQGWRAPGYSWRFNTISDLGNTACGNYGSRFVCSPHHSLMNASFIVLGVLMASGCLLIYQEFTEKLSSLVGFSLMGLAGCGTILVGLFPENTIGGLHILGASLPFLLGNLSLSILSFGLYKVNKVLRIYTFLSGFVALVGLILFMSHNYLGLGIGGMERIVAYPQTIWLIGFGAYMSRNRFTAAKPSQS